MSFRSSLWLCASLLLWAASPVQARVKINYQSTSRAWSDSSAVQPEGGNRGRTLGEQRKIAFEYALGLWEGRLDGEVPIEIEVTFSSLGCEDGAVVLGQASNGNWFSELAAPGANPDWWYPSALANQLVGEDLLPDQPDVVMAFNDSVDAECKSLTAGFYYGLDSASGERVDFVNVVLHELGHGLGIASTLDPETGLPAADGATGIDVYSAHLHDLDQDRSWDGLSGTERMGSMQNVRRVAWDGPRTSERVAIEQSRGEPTVTLDPPLAGFSGFVADSNLGTLPLSAAATGELYALRGCAMPQQLPPGLVLLFSERCLADMENVVSVIRNARAAGALLIGSGLAPTPPFPVDAVTLTAAAEVPVFVVSAQDARTIMVALQSGVVSARLAANPGREIGADDRHRPLVYISRPYTPGSSISHLEPLLRPDQLMEPTTGPVPSHNLALTVAMLADMGWGAGCGDGTQAGSELCDDGPGNSDLVPDACRSDCTRSRCGDGVRDSAESCDDGQSNSDVLANRCRTDCRVARCGDGVLDKGEQCDDGADNSDTRADACRLDCARPSCGDHVRDRGEDCDEGADNSDSLADACRNDCSAARCGDGVRDRGEQCDDGRSNSASQPDACRLDCALPGCGDGVRDRGEACDAGRRNSDEAPDACRTDCSTAYCGDGVVDSDESCDGPDCVGYCGTAKLQQAARFLNEEPPVRDKGGCGCRVGGPLSTRRGWLSALGIVLACGIARRRRRRSARLDA
jgi:hypothetical protein